MSFDESLSPSRGIFVSAVITPLASVPESLCGSVLSLLVVGDGFVDFMKGNLGLAVTF